MPCIIDQRHPKREQELKAKMGQMIQKANQTRSRSKEKLFDKLYLKNGENFKNLEEDDK